MISLGPVASACVHEIGLASASPFGAIATFPFRQRMRFVVGVFEALGGHVGVDLRGAQVPVAQ